MMFAKVNYVVFRLAPAAALAALAMPPLLTFCLFGDHQELEDCQRRALRLFEII
jgi:hypothetical protein